MNKKAGRECISALSVMTHDCPSGPHSKPEKVGPAAESAKEMKLKKTKQIFELTCSSLCPSKSGTSPETKAQSAGQPARSLRAMRQVQPGMIKKETKMHEITIGHARKRKGVQPDIDKETKRTLGFGCRAGRRENAEHAPWRPKLARKSSEHLHVLVLRRRR